MPSTSKKQANFMRAVAHSPKFAKKVGVSQSVGKDFEMADKKMKKFGSGGKMPPQPSAAEKAASAKYRAGLKNVKVSPAEGRVIESANRSEGSGMMKKAKGGMMADKAGRAMTKKSADTMGRAMKKCGGGSMKKYAKGGSVSSRADGIAKKGKTNTKHVTMKKGGMC